VRSPTTEEVLALLHPGIQKWVRHESGWPGLSPIQLSAIPSILEGRDCVIEAPTAGGKTEAVLFPTLTKAAANEAGRSVRVLYLAPLRALLNNLETRGEDYAKLCGLRAFKWHGDVGQKDKKEAFQDPPDLLLTTPESMEAILLRKADWSEVFSGLGTVIIDEAHNFADGERGGHLLSLLERLSAATDKPVQRIALSATLGNPETMLRWLAGSQQPLGQRIHAGAQTAKKKDFKIHFFEAAPDTETVAPDQQPAWRQFNELFNLVAGKVSGIGTKSLVFVGSRRKAESFARAFKHANDGLPLGQRVEIRTHHSAVSRFFREEAESLIQLSSADSLHAILSTSTLELGIDIGELNQVIQMDSLSSPSSFLQRVGRTGRRQGRPQFFRGLTLDLDHLQLQTATVSLGLQGRSEALLLPQKAFHLMAHQLICLSLQSYGADPAHVWRTLSRAHCFSAITRDEFEALVDHMVETEYLRRVDGHLLLTGDKTEKSFLHSNWRRLFAVFDSAPLYEVLHGRVSVGTLDAKFVEAQDFPFYFVLGGKLWKTERISQKIRQVHASPSKDGAAPAWVNFGGPDVPFETAQEVGRLLQESEPPTFLDETARSVFADLQAGSRGLNWKPGRIHWRVAASGTAYLVTYAGDRINRTLARLLNLTGAGKATASYAEVRFTSKPPDPEAITDAIEATLSDLRDGAWSDPPTLSKALQKQQPLVPFSPFARCLPKSLWAATLVEQTLDMKGLLNLV